MMVLKDGCGCWILMWGEIYRSAARVKAGMRVYLSHRCDFCDFFWPMYSRAPVLIVH